MERMVLARHDAEGYVVLDAISHVTGPPSGSLANPHHFLAIDGKGYWIKAAAQGGLINELVGGRLASALGAGPMARILRVPNEALPADGTANHLEGVNVGLEDLPGRVNVKDLGLLGVTQLDLTNVRAEDRATVVAFHSWTGMNDAQVLVNMQSGRLSTIDFGDCFNGMTADPTLVIVDLPGLNRDHGKDHALAAAARVEAITDDQLIAAVARIPSGGPWGPSADVDSRFKLAEHLAARRANVAKVMATW
jgi:hypothetical protein